MAFGSRKGSLKTSATSVTNPLTASGSVAVVVGDLVVAHFAERTTPTGGTVSDNLGNTYTAPRVATDAGNATGRAYYSRVTVAGTLTSVSVATTASTDDASFTVAIYEGPFPTSPLDKNPADDTTDTTSPETCPLSTALAQADELVVGCMATTNGLTATGVSSGNLDVAQTSAGEGAANSIGSAIGSFVVSATTSTSVAFTTASNPAQVVLHTLTFKKDLSAGVGAATGAGAASGAGKATTNAPGSATGAGAAAATGQSIFNAVGSASGSGAASGTGVAAKLAVGLAHGGGLDGTVFLMHADGTDASTTFTDALGHTIFTQGDAQVDTGQSKFGGASAQFDGTGDVLLVQGATDFAFGTGDFTIDFWIRINSLGTQNNVLVMESGSFAIYQATSGEFRFFKSGDLITGGTTPGNNTWHHIALTRASGTTRLFLNGGVEGTVSDSNNYASTDLAIGANANGTFCLTGWMDEVRVIKGRAAWTAAFTPPGQPYADGFAVGRGKAITNGVGAASGSGAGAATGKSIFNGVGSATGSGAGAGVGDFVSGGAAIRAVVSWWQIEFQEAESPTTDAAGATAGNGAAAAVGKSIVNAVGTASGSGAATAAGVGGSIASAVGTADAADIVPNILLLLRADATDESTTFTDLIGLHTFTPHGQVKIDTEQSKFGGSSIKFDGTTDWISTTDTTDITLGTSDFTIDFWFYNTAASAFANFFTYQSGDIIPRLAGGDVNVFAVPAGGDMFSGTATPSLNAWHHFALTRSGNDHRLFLDGTQTGSTYTAANNYNGSSSVVAIGANTDGTNSLNGWMDEIRLVKGTALWTSNFTPPSAPYPFGGATGVGASTVAAVGSASGSGAASGVGASLFNGVGSATGSGVASGLADSGSAVGAATGTGTASGVGASIFKAVGSASGSGAAAGIGQSTAASAGAAAGTGNAAATGNANFQGVGSASGTGTANGAGKSNAAAAGSASGTGAASGIGASTAASAASAAGTGTGAAVGAPTVAATGSATGTGNASGVGRSTANSVGNAAGTGAASGVSDSGTSNGSATGTGTATGVGQSTAASAGSASGNGAAAAVGASIASAVGSASGSGAASASGVAAFRGVGSASGTSTAAAVGQSIFNGVGSAAGNGAAAGIGQATTNSVGNATGAGAANGFTGQANTANATGTGTATGVGRSTAASVGSASGSGVATGVGQANTRAAGAAAGNGTASGTGIGAGIGTGSASGTSTATSTGRSTAAGVGDASGVGVGIGIGNQIGTSTRRRVTPGVGRAGGAPQRSAEEFEKRPSQVSAKRRIS